MTKMATIPIYGKKKLLNVLPWNQWNNVNETWYEASGTTSHHSLFKVFPYVGLYLFYGKVKCCALVFYIEKYDRETITAFGWKLISK